MIYKLGMVSAVLMPFFDIPLIWRIVRRKSSEDISLVWTFGIWACILGMLPASLVSADPILKAFGIVDEIVPEPLGGAHRDPVAFIERVMGCVDAALTRLAERTPQELLSARYEKYRRIGQGRSHADPAEGAV